MTMASWAAALAAAVAVLPASASAVPVVVHLETASAKTGVELVFTPAGAASKGAEPGAEPRGARSVETAAPGEATIDLPAGSRWSLTARARGLWSRSELFEAAAGTDVSVRLLPAGVIRAELQTAPGETLPTELSLRITSAPAGPGGRPSLSTSETCPVKDRQVACPAPAGTFDLRLRAKGFVSAYRWEQRVPAGADLELGKLTLRRGASVVGTVAAPARGFRYQDCRVELAPRVTVLPTASETAQNAERAEVARVSARGFFELAGIAPGTYRLTVRHPQYAPATVVPVEVVAGAETEIQRIDLHPPVALEVRLTPATDAYARRWSVRLSREGEVLGVSALVAEGVVDAKGKWKRTGLEPGEYSVEAIDGRGARWAARRLTLGSEPTTIDLDVPFQRVRGTVTLGGEPLAATLEFGGAHGELQIRARSDEKGAYRVFLPWKKQWDVDVTANDPHVASHLHGLAIVSLEHAPGVLDIALPDTRLPVEVVDDQGQAVPRASVRALREGDRTPLAERFASPEGKVEFRGLAVGVWHLEADGTDAAGNRESADTVKVELREKERPEPVRLVLKHGWKLAGEVVSPDGSGVFGAEIIATLEGGPSLAHLEIPTTHTDLDGSFTLDVPTSATGVRLTVLPAGFTLRQLSPVGPNDGPLIIAVDQQGGTLVVEGTGNLEESLDNGTAPQIIGRYPLLLPLAYSWAYLNGSASWPAGEMIIPMLEPGQYTVCRQGQGRAGAAQCASGVLMAGGRLVLRIPNG